MLVDQPVQRFAQRNRSGTSDDLAAFVRHMGQPEVYVTTSLGLIGAGLIAGRPQVAKAGGRAGVSVALAAALELSLKGIIGRARPDSGLGASHFDPFSGSESLPSGHSALSFALATSLAGDITAGALIGITSAKLVGGKWQVLGLRPPGVLVARTGTPVFGWSFSF